MTKLLVTALGLMIAGQSFAANVVQCLREEKVVFEGLARVDLIKVSDGMSVVYSEAVSTTPVDVIDRRTLQRTFGIELPNCNAPYARIYARLSAGSLRCNQIVLKEETKIVWTNENVLNAVAGNEAACSVMLTQKSLQKLR